MYINSNSTVRMWWSTDSVFDTLNLRTVYSVRTTPNSGEQQQVDNVDLYALSQDERDFMIEHLSEVIYGLYSIFAEYSRVSGDSLYVDELQEGRTEKSSGFSVCVNRCASDSLLKVLDTECFEYITNTLLIRWWESVHSQNDTVTCMDKKTICEINIRRLLSDVTRPAYRRSYTAEEVIEKVILQ